jgi:hypothetical protein
MATLTQFPSFDASVYFNDGGATIWSTMRGAANGTNTDSAVATYDNYARFLTSAIDRSFFIFDTSSITAGMVVTAASLFVMPSSLTGSGEEIGVIGCTPASDSAVQASDYSCYSSLNSPTEYATRTTGASSTVDTYKEIVFNADGIAAINKTGNTRIMLREGHDIDNSASGTTFYDYQIYSRNQTGTSKDPYLVVTYGSTFVSPLPTHFRV